MSAVLSALQTTGVVLLILIVLAVPFVAALVVGGLQLRRHESER